MRRAATFDLLLGTLLGDPALGHDWNAALWKIFRRDDAVATALREPGVRELRRIAELRSSKRR